MADITQDPIPAEAQPVEVPVETPAPEPAPAEPPAPALSFDELTAKWKAGGEAAAALRQQIYDLTLQAEAAEREGHEAYEALTKNFPDLYRPR